MFLRDQSIDLVNATVAGITVTWYDIHRYLVSYIQTGSIGDMHNFVPLNIVNNLEGEDDGLNVEVSVGRQVVADIL